MRWERRDAKVEWIEVRGRAGGGKCVLGRTRGSEDGDGDGDGDGGW